MRGEHGSTASHGECDDQSIGDAGRSVPDQVRRSRDSSVAEVLELEPSVFGQTLLVVGTGVLTDEGRVADIVAVDAATRVHVISVAHGVADVRSVIDLEQMLDSIERQSVEDLRQLYAANHPEGAATLDEAFIEQFGAGLAAPPDRRPRGIVVAAALADSAIATLEALDEGQERLQAFAYQEYVDDEAGETYVMTNKLF